MQRKIKVLKLSPTEATGEISEMLSWQKIPAKIIKFCCFRDMEHYEECCKVFQMGINSANYDSERVCEAMLQFEREHGLAIANTYL